MTGTGIAGLVFRLWGVMWILTGLAYLPQAVLIPLSFDNANEINQSILALSTVASVVVHVSIGLFLFLRGQWIADALFAHYDLPLNVNISVKDLQAILLGLLGLYLIFEGIQQYATVLYNVKTRPQWQGMSGFEYAWADQRLGLLGGAIDLLFGTIVLLGRAGFARLWRVIHPMGAPSDIETDGDNSRSGP